MMSRTKIYIKNTKATVEGLLKYDTMVLTDTEKISNDEKVKSQLRTTIEQVNHKSHNKDMLEILLLQWIMQYDFQYVR